MQSTVMLMTPDAAVSADVVKVLKGNGHVFVAHAARDVRELAMILKSEAAPRVVLLDIDPQPRQVLGEIARISERYTTTRFVALSANITDVLLEDAMEAGVRRVLSKNRISSDLQDVLYRLTPGGSHTEGPHGEVITILSAGGGSGATTIAANLASELGAHRDGEPALLVDLDLAFGSLAHYFGLKPRYAIDHVLDYDRHVDGDLIRSTASVVNARVHLMASPASTSFSHPTPANLEHLDRVLVAARQAYKYVIIDAPRVSPDTAAALAAMSTHVLLVFQLTVQHIHIAKAMLEAMRERGVTSGVVPVANRFAKSAMISVADATSALQGMAVKTLRNDYAGAVEGCNFGRALMDAAPRSVLRRDISELIGALKLVM